MQINRWHGVSALATVSAVALVLAVALISALVADPVSITVAIQRGDTAALAQALLDVLGAAARAILRLL
jgi:mannose/fructose/N-acetylgalactosamine-specific phosphotransferase system component IID